MQEKDITEKTLESYNDVFSDIVNTLLFNGEKVVDEKDLIDAQPFSQYKISNKIHQQERDVAKYWMNGPVKICLYGMENQTKIDSTMPLRIISYDGTAYRDQVSKTKTTDQKYYPVVTMVLYFGMERWNRRKLSECLEIPTKFKDYVSDYKINVFEIAWLSPEKVMQFKSDFRIVADYFVQKRINKNYIASKDTIRHVDEILKLMNVLTEDNRYENIQRHYEKLDVQTKEGTNMCEVLTKWHDDGFNKGMIQGMSQGRTLGITETIKNFLALNICTTEQISQATGLSVEEIENLKDSQ